MKFIKPIIALIVVGGLAFWIFTTLGENKETIDANAQIKEEILPKFQ